MNPAEKWNGFYKLEKRENVEAFMKELSKSLQDRLIQGRVCI